MAKSYHAATVDVGRSGKKVTYRSAQFDEHHHLHMAPDKDNKPDVITFKADSGYAISEIDFDPTDGPFDIMTPLPSATVVVHDRNDGSEKKRFGFTITLEDELGNHFQGSDPKIVNDPGN